MDLKTLLDLIANQGFPIALSILLIFRIDRFMQEDSSSSERELSAGLREYQRDT
jgi:hypothetical protein